MLRENDALPSQKLIARCPVSTRKAGDKSLGDHMGSMMVSVATDLADPIARLNEIRRESQRAKRGVEEDWGLDMLKVLVDTLTPTAIGALLGVAAEHIDDTPLPANFVFSNVRGISHPI